MDVLPGYNVSLIAVPFADGRDGAALNSALRFMARHMPTICLVQLAFIALPGNLLALVSLSKAYRASRLYASHMMVVLNDCAIAVSTLLLVGLVSDMAFFTDLMGVDGYDLRKIQIVAWYLTHLSVALVNFFGIAGIFIMAGVAGERLRALRNGESSRTSAAEVGRRLTWAVAVAYAIALVTSAHEMFRQSVHEDKYSGRYLSVDNSGNGGVMTTLDTIALLARSVGVALLCALAAGLLYLRTCGKSADRAPTAATGCATVGGSQTESDGESTAQLAAGQSTLMAACYLPTVLLYAQRLFDSSAASVAFYAFMAALATSLSVSANLLVLLASSRRFRAFFADAVALKHGRGLVTSVGRRIADVKM